MKTWGAPLPVGKTKDVCYPCQGNLTISLTSQGQILIHCKPYKECLELGFLWKL